MCEFAGRKNKKRGGKKKEYEEEEDEDESPRSVSASTSGGLVAPNSGTGLTANKTSTYIIPYSSSESESDGEASFWKVRYI